MTDQRKPDEKPAPKPIAAGLAFSGLCNVRNTEGHLRWLGAQLGFFLNLPAWAGIASRFISKPQTPELILLLVGSLFFGIANMFLHEIIKRDSKLMDLWNDKLVQIFSSRRYRKLRGSRSRLQFRLQYAMIASTVVWALAASAAAVMLVLIRIGG
jgi:hypothetical protein